MEENFLPIGSVVKLKGGQKRLMITGFLQVEQEENKKNVWDYSGCLYPEGMITSENNYVFNHSQIEDIYFTGLVDEEEEEFKKRLKIFSALLSSVISNAFIINLTGSELISTFIFVTGRKFLFSNISSILPNSLSISRIYFNNILLLFSILPPLCFFSTFYNPPFYRV